MNTFDNLSGAIIKSRPAANHHGNGVDRVIPLAVWLAEHTHGDTANMHYRYWRSNAVFDQFRDGRRYCGPAYLGGWLCRHEQVLVTAGAVFRHGQAWRLIEPRFSEVAAEILAAPAGTKTRQKPHDALSGKLLSIAETLALGIRQSAEQQEALRDIERIISEHWRTA